MVVQSVGRIVVRGCYKRQHTEPEALRISDRYTPRFAECRKTIATPNRQRIPRVSLAALRGTDDSQTLPRRKADSNHQSLFIKLSGEAAIAAFTGADVEGLIGAGQHERSYFPHYLEPRKTSEKALVRSSRKLGSAASRPGTSTTWCRRWACPAFEEPSLQLVQRN